MLRPYLGEFLLVPYPLELSIIEPCDYACRYCFAILNDRTRESFKGKSPQANKIKDILTLIKNSRTRSGLDAKLLNWRYPILLSNRTDPFGRKNRFSTLTLLEVFAGLGIPVAFQTKGMIKHDEDFERTMDLVKPSHWYISISFTDDKDRARVEPGAPPLEYRWEFIKELKKRGHVVSVGWNPFVPEWFGGLEGGYKFIEKMVEHGVDAVALQMLHLSATNHDQMTEREIQDLSNGDEVWMEMVARRKSRPTAWIPVYRELMKASYDAGLGVIGNWFGWGHPLWESTHALYDRTFPTLADFAWHCKQTKQLGDPITFAEFRDWFSNWPVPTIVGNTGHAITMASWRLPPKIAASEGKKKFNEKMSYQKMLWYGWRWQDKIPEFSPAGMPCFCPLVDREENLILCDDNLPVLAWAPAETHPLDYYGSWVQE